MMAWRDVHATLQRMYVLHRRTPLVACQGLPGRGAQGGVHARSAAHGGRRPTPAMASPVPTAKLQKLYAAQFAERGRLPPPEAQVQRSGALLDAGTAPGAGQRRADPFKLAVWMAMAGNYIDFGILKEVDDARLKRMLATPDERAVGTPVLEELRADVRSAPPPGLRLRQLRRGGAGYAADGGNEERKPGDCRSRRLCAAKTCSTT